jgi:predicted nuclease of predicted toxin-antitoxin system
MRFLADMGISRAVTDWLRSSGHDVIHLHDEGLHRLPNGEIFLKAAREKRVILTFDLDFGEILALISGHRVSVILFRLHNTRSSNLCGRLQVVLRDSSEQLEQGTIVVVEEARHRVRRWPPLDQLQ